MSKKICICTTVSVTQKCFVVPTAEYLKEKCGYDITLVCAPDREFEDSIPSGIKFRPVNMARGIDFKAVKPIHELTRLFKREKFDLVQYSTPNAALYASIAAKRAGIPIRLYCQWGIRYTGMSGCKRKFFKMIEKLTCNLSTDIRSVSPMNRAFGIRERLYADKKVRMIGNGGTIGVDLEEYDIREKQKWFSETRQKLKLSVDDFVFGFSGRISKDKGSEELIRAFMRFDDPHVKLVIIGKVDDKSDIDPALIEFLKSSPNVICTGWIANRQMNQYYSALDVLVHPTYREGFGMVIQEAGALGIPCITTKIIGASEVMVDGESCALVEPKNVEELYSAMKDLHENRALTKRIGEAAYLRTKSLYERNIMLEHQRKDYISLLGG